MRKGKIPVLDPAEERALLDSIDVSTPIVLRDRARSGRIVSAFTGGRARYYNRTKLERLRSTHGEIEDH